MVTEEDGTTINNYHRKKMKKRKQNAKIYSIL